MKKYINIEIKNSKEKLVGLLNSLKEDDKNGFIFQKKLTEDYAKNIFVRIENVACFKTRKQSLFESSVWLLLKDNRLIITNITSAKFPHLGISRYNFVLNTFFHSIIAPKLDASYSVNISGEDQSLEDILDSETYAKLNLWENSCNKSMPISHPLDYERWFSFILSAFHNHSEITPQDLAQWLSEDKKWPQVYNDQISNLKLQFEYSMDLLNYEHHESR